DVAANDPVHGAAGRKIVQNVPNGLRLVDRREIRKTRDKPLIDGARRYKFRSSPAASLADVFGELLGGDLNFLLRLRTPGPPCTSIRFVQGLLAKLRCVRPDQGEVSGWNQNGIISRKYEPDHFPRRSVPGCHRLQSVEQGQSPLQMNDYEAYLRHICVVERRIPSPGHRLRMMSPAAEYVGSSHDHKRFPAR